MRSEGKLKFQDTASKSLLVRRRRGRSLATSLRVVDEEDGGGRYRTWTFPIRN